MKRMLPVSGMLLALFFCFAIHAQEMETFAGLRLHYDDPGVRAHAMGGASAALHDDADALVNPAAIAGTRRRTISIEARDTSSDARFLTPAAAGFSSVENSSSHRGLSNISVTMPLGRAAISLFADEPLHANSDTGSIAWDRTYGPHPVLTWHGRIVDPSDCAMVVCTPVMLGGPEAWNASIRNRRYGAAAAWQAGSLAIGASIRSESLDQDSTLTHPQMTEAVVNAVTHDHALTYGAGLQWQVLPALRVGVAYASGARFDGTRTATPSGTTSPLSMGRPATLRAGVAIEPSSSLSITADAVRVGYHDTESELLTRWSNAIPDVTEYHAGIEYRLGGVALRGGWWRDPAHELRNPVGGPFPFNNVLQLERADEDHVTLGTGFGSPRLHVDASFDRGRRSRQASVALASTF